MKQEMVAATPVLPGIALRGQSTVIYAPPNTGKTLLVLHMLVEAIEEGHIDAEQIFYLNMDDNTQGLFEKAALAEKYGFELISEGRNGFEAKDWDELSKEIMRSGKASQSIIVLDTLKKFTEVMDKRIVSGFTTSNRMFTSMGATVIALGHTNKKRGFDGGVVFSGTQDVPDDFDCACTLQTVVEENAAGRKVVEFKNFKRRGNVALSVSFSYSNDPSISYSSLFDSVERLNADGVATIKDELRAEADGPIIAAIEAIIGEGVDIKKMDLKRAVAKRANVSEKIALTILERYTGRDPDRHRWTFETVAHGAKVFALLDRPNGDASDAPAAAD